MNSMIICEATCKPSRARFENASSLENVPPTEATVVTDDIFDRVVVSSDGGSTKTVVSASQPLWLATWI
jgi:FMN phosphatase YigB (HAD superfamily)